MVVCLCVVRVIDTCSDISREIVQLSKTDLTNQQIFETLLSLHCIASFVPNNQNARLYCSSSGLRCHVRPRACAARLASSRPAGRCSTSLPHADLAQHAEHAADDGRTLEESQSDGLAPSDPEGSENHARRARSHGHDDSQGISRSEESQQTTECVLCTLVILTRASLYHSQVSLCLPTVKFVRSSSN